MHGRHRADLLGGHPGHQEGAGGLRLGELLRANGLAVEPQASGALLVAGVTPERVGAVAAEHGVALSELVAVSRSLEDAFLELTSAAA